MTAAMPLTPIATSVSPRRHARPKVSETMIAVSTPVRARQRVADVLRGTVGVDGQQRGLTGFHVRQIDACIRAHEAVSRLADDEVAAPAHDPHRLRFDQPVSRLDVVRIEGDETSFGLGDDLLGDDETITILERRLLRDRCRHDQFGDLVAWSHHADARDRDDLNRLHQGATRRRPGRAGRGSRRPPGSASSCRRRRLAHRLPRPRRRGGRRSRR